MTISELIEEAMKRGGWFSLNTALKDRWKAEGPIIWECRLSAPEAFEATGDTPEEAIAAAIALYDKVMSEAESE